MSTSLNRREFLRTGIAAGAVLLPAASLLAACERAGGTPGTLERLATASTARSSPAREVRLVAEAGEVEVGALGTYRTWLYNGEFPGPEIRVREGERLRIAVENRLPEGTTV
ncbi:MAG: multicopper oxidase domain-containing protein, partial [Longimicrobiaceae bacterium]